MWPTDENTLAVTQHTRMTARFETRRQRIAAVLAAVWLVSALALSVKNSSYQDRRDDYKIDLSKAISAFLMFGVLPVILVAGVYWVRTARPKTQHLPSSDHQQRTVRAIGPPCPTCKRPTELRTSQAPSLAGKYFWGCTGYPTCPQITVVTISPEQSDG